MGFGRTGRVKATSITQVSVRLSLYVVMKIARYQEATTATMFVTATLRLMAASRRKQRLTHAIVMPTCPSLHLIQVRKSFG